MKRFATILAILLATMATLTATTEVYAGKSTISPCHRPSWEASVVLCQQMGF